MVVFTCNYCGDSLQKPKVEKHYNFVCRAKKSLTCVDCLKDFFGEDYNAHIKCVTEEERYAPKGTFKNGIVKKGELKQEQWSDMIQSILQENSNLKPNCKNMLNHIVNFSNVPRKKPKFMNFMKSTMGGRVDFKTVEDVWNIIEEHKNKSLKAVPENQQQLKRKIESENGTDIKKPKVEIETEIANEDNAPKFDLSEEITKVLNKKQSISLNKLEKKLWKKYTAHVDNADLDKFKKRFAKKLKKNPNVSIESEIVSIKQN